MRLKLFPQIETMACSLEKAQTQMQTMMDCQKLIYSKFIFLLSLISSQFHIYIEMGGIDITARFTALNRTFYYTRAAAVISQYLHIFPLTEIILFP